MSPFAAPQPKPRPSWLARFSKPLVLVVLVTSLVLGSAAVFWRAQARIQATRVRLQAEAQAAAAALAWQCQNSLAPAEVLAAALRQGGAMPLDLQKVGPELLALRPAIATLEFQPGGVTTDLVPRSGNERLVGWNVFKDPVQRPGANLSMQKKVVSITGPVRLPRGDPGIMARVPVFQRGRDGRESFWGFVALSVRLPEIWKQARLHELVSNGCHYAVLAPDLNTDKTVVLASSGNWRLADAVQQPVRLHNLEFRLALGSQTSWLTKMRVLLDGLAVLAGSGLLSLLAVLLTNQLAMETALAEANRQLVRETTERKHALEGLQSAQEKLTASAAELKQLRTSCQQAEATVGQLAAKAVQAESAARQLQSRLDEALAAAESAAQQNQTELKQVRTALTQAEQKLAAVQGRLDEAVREHQATVASVQQRAEQAQERVAGLTHQLEKSKAHTAELGTHLERSGAHLTDLTFQLAQRDTRVTELAAQLEQAQVQLRRQHSPLATHPETPSPDLGPSQPAEAVRDETLEPLPDNKATLIESADSEHDGTASTEPTQELPEGSSFAPEPEAEGKSVKTHKRKQALSHNQMDLFGAAAPSLESMTATELKAPPHDSAPGEKLLPSDEGIGSPGDLDATEEEKPVVEASSLKDPTSAASSIAAADHTLQEGAPRKEHKRAPIRALSPDQLAELRTVLHQIVPLLGDQDPGAKDCLKDNRSTFRAAFHPEAYAEFEQSVKGGQYSVALEYLRRAARRQGISV